MLLTLAPEKFEKIYEEMAINGVSLASPSEFSLDACFIADGLHCGDTLSFLGMKGKNIEFREGELTVVAGPSGHGKSAFMGQVALDLARQHKKVCILSLEMSPGRTLWRMARIEYGLKVCGWLPQYKDTAGDATEGFCKSVEKDILLLNKVGSATSREVFGVMAKANELGCKHIIIDNLMRVCPEYGDRANEAQKEFIQDLIALTKYLKVHTWLVHHVRKGSNETDEINKYSIRGAAAITDNADNVILLQRNLKKEKSLEEAGDDIERCISIDREDADSTFIIDKQRNGEWQGRIGLWYSKEFMRFWPTFERK